MVVSVILIAAWVLHLCCSASDIDGWGREGREHIVVNTYTYTMVAAVTPMD